MKKLIIISEGKNTGNTLTNQLNLLMGKYIEIDNILLSEIRNSKINADIILFTTEHVKERAIRYINQGVLHLICQRVIDHKNIKEIISIKKGEQVLLVNDDYSTTKEAIAQLLELGLDHIKYYEYYPGCISYPKLETIITPGEPQLIPYTPKNLININTRILDIKTIHEIASILGLEKHIDYSLVTDYIRDIVEISKSIDESRKDIEESEKILEVMVDGLDYGVGFIDNNSKLIRVNSKFEYILGKKKKDIINKKFNYLFSQKDIIKLVETNFIIEIENKKVSVDIRRVNFSYKVGYIIYLKILKNTDNRNLNTDKKYKDILNRKLHSFNDYLTVEEDTLAMIHQAKKFAKTESTILIEGENGTGKEILAQGIHMDSYRRNNIFIPINMTTISANLLESELFGYEEGTFTGAIKGGKLGLFEMANGGTIFIDEIGDTPFEVQAKLLRVLEERRIRKVGGIEEIPIDVRIIAATNKNLLKLVEEGLFRIDLFFRLNILPLHTTSLRNRKKDINYLLKHFININLGKKINNLDEFLEVDTIEFLNDYKWIGNVRELINLVEYLVLIYEGKPLGINSLHNYMKSSSFKKENMILDKDELWVLNKFNENNNVLGRVKLKEIAINENINLGEGKIRRIIESLKNHNLINPIKNYGCKINEKGKSILNSYR